MASVSGERSPKMLPNVKAIIARVFADAGNMNQSNPMPEDLVKVHATVEASYR